jgi:hypothetical protein
MTAQEIKDIAARICGALTEFGFEYHFEADNRSGWKSCYIYVRKPIYMEIRISDHPQNKVKRRKQFDIGPHGMSPEAAIAEIKQLREWVH